MTEIVGEGSRSHLILPANDKNIPWTGLLVLAFSTNVWYYCTNQTINQSVLGAKNEWHAKLGIIFAGLLWILIAFADVFPGLIAFVLDPDIQPDSAYPWIVNKLVPSGLKGIVFAGLCGAIISTIEAVINASSTIFSYDVYRRFIKKDATDREMIRTGRIASGIILIVGAAWAPMVLKFGHIFSYFQECWAFVSIPVAVIFLGGLLWKRVNSKTAFIMLLLSFPMFLAPYLLRILKVEMNVFNVAGFFLVGFILIFVVTTLLTRTTELEKEPALVWRPSMVKLPEGLTAINRIWYRNLFFWGSVMVALYVLIYIVFW
jgi:SSS family solute:Na+ symporter